MRDSVKLRGCDLTRQGCIDAAKEIALDKGWKAPKSQKFVVVIDGKEYPPKKIASAVTGLPVSGFSGGAELNGKFAALGFEVRAK
jgi:hypothetical protein